MESQGFSVGPNPVQETTEGVILVQSMVENGGKRYGLAGSWYEVMRHEGKLPANQVGSSQDHETVFLSTGRQCRKIMSLVLDRFQMLIGYVTEDSQVYKSLARERALKAQIS